MHRCYLYYYHVQPLYNGQDLEHTPVPIAGYDLEHTLVYVAGYGLEHTPVCI